MDHIRTSRPPRVSSHKTDKSRVSVKSLPAIKTTSLHETRALGLSLGGRHSTTGTPQSIGMATYKQDRSKRVKAVSFNESLNTVDDLSEEKWTKHFSDVTSNVSSETFAKDKQRTPGSQTERPWLHNPDVEVYSMPLSTARSVPVVQWRKISSVPEADVLRDTDDVGGGGGGASGDIDLTPARGSSVTSVLVRFTSLATASTVSVTTTTLTYPTNQ
ncbi:hypothetical protein MAR_021947 [Mya arenaria]|uniref:Uncharacterized protein n=1 Tax=Mya arenaria TaxID=6604 RepID=A0ABY7ECY7_MYAAR|nr:hypothetical protein MAR_021947 [Mya arenaria]